MPLTVANALGEINPLSSALVVAGRAGLNRIIRWTHIVDFPDVVPWVRAGDFLLTTAFALKDNPAIQRELIPSLVEKDLSGMAVAIGRYFNEIPPEMIRAADELAFPIITVPFEVRFVEITQAIHRRIINEQYDLLAKSFHIHRVLTQLVLEERGLGAVADSLAKLLNRSVTIEDASFQLLAHGVAAPEDDARLRTIAEGRTAEELIAHLTAQGLFEELRKNPAPRRIPPVPELGMTLERIIAPIVVGTQLYGYVWIIATNNPLTDLDFQAIASTAIVAALIITRQQAIYEAEQRLKDGLLNNLLDPDPYRDIVNVTDTLQRLGLQRGYQIMVIEEISSKVVNLSRLSTSIEEKMRVKNAAATVIQRGQRLIMLVGTTHGQQGTDAAHSLVEMASRQGLSLMIGIGIPSRQAAQVRQCYQEALEALQVGRMLSANQPGVWAFQDLGFLHWLRTLPPDLQSTNRYSTAIRAIEEYDRAHSTEFLKTLEVYLDHLSNRQQAARTLIIHRNTLNQRLAKIEENWNIDLKDSQALINLLVAIKSYRLGKRD